MLDEVQAIAAEDRADAAALVDRGLLHLEERRHSVVDPLLAEYLRRLGHRP